MSNINVLVELVKQYELNKTKENNRLRDDIVTEYNETIESLPTIEESVINKDISLLPVYKINEGYAIDLDSLKYVVESENITLENAIQKIKDVNYIGDLYPMYCVLPSDINKKITLENFCDLYKSLSESGIIPVISSDFKNSEFIATTKK